MKRITIISAAILLSVAMCLASCSGNADPSIDVIALCDEMKAADTFPEMLNIRSGDGREERGFAAISDLDFPKVASFSLYYAADGSAYELAVISMKDAADIPALEASLEAHIHTRVEQYRNYDASQVPRAERAVVAVSGRYAALIMCDDPAAVRAVFDKALRSSIR